MSQFTLYISLFLILFLTSERCSGQTIPVLTSTLNFTNGNNRTGCLNSRVVFNCVGYGTNIRIVSPPLVPETDPILFFNDDGNGTQAFRGSNSEAVSILEKNIPDGSGNSDFTVTLSLPLNFNPLGPAVTECHVPQGSNVNMFTVIDIPPRVPTDRLNADSTTISWEGPEEATNYEIRTNTTPTSVQTTSATSLTLSVGPGSYEVQVISNNTCGLSNASVIDVTVLNATDRVREVPREQVAGLTAGLVVSVFVSGIVITIIILIAALFYFKQKRAVAEAKDQQAKAERAAAEAEDKYKKEMRAAAETKSQYEKEKRAAAEAKAQYEKEKAKYEKEKAQHEKEKRVAAETKALYEKEKCRRAVLEAQVKILEAKESEKNTKRYVSFLITEAVEGSSESMKDEPVVKEGKFDSAPPHTKHQTLADGITLYSTPAGSLSLEFDKQELLNSRWVKKLKK